MTLTVTSVTDLGPAHADHEAKIRRIFSSSLKSPQERETGTAKHALLCAVGGA